MLQRHVFVPVIFPSFVIWKGGPNQRRHRPNFGNETWHMHERSIDVWFMNSLFFVLDLLIDPVHKAHLNDSPTNQTLLLSLRFTCLSFSVKAILWLWCFCIFFNTRKHQSPFTVTRTLNVTSAFSTFSSSVFQ